MKNLFPIPVGLEIRDTNTSKGLGVYATKEILSGEVVEHFPVILFDLPYDELPIELKRYSFNWGFLAKSEAPCAIALGFGSLYNHSNPSNLRYEAVPNHRSMQFIATRDISVGEELTINYESVGGGTNSEDGVWFQEVGIVELK